MKSQFSISMITKEECSSILSAHHYLGGSFKSGFNVGLFCDGKLNGCLVFSPLPVPEIAVGAFGLERNDQGGLFDISRLCVSPEVQATEHNISSWFVARAIKLLRKQTTTRAILSYADNDHHTGTIYRACNFNYYGLTTEKKDFWIKQENGSYKKHIRGKVKGLDGEWRPRSRKHRFLLVFDKSLTVRWKNEGL